MGHVNHFNFSGRRAYFPRVQWEQTAVDSDVPRGSIAHVIRFRSLSLLHKRASEIGNLRKVFKESLSLEAAEHLNRGGGKSYYSSIFTIHGKAVTQ